MRYNEAMKHAAPALLLTSLLAVGCAASSSSDEAAPRPARDQPSAEALAEIAQHEDHRTAGDGRLAQFLAHPDTDVRVHAATALGRLWWPEEGAAVTAPLIVALSDDQAAVRAAAAFALGMRGDPSAGNALSALGLHPELKDPHPLVRARAVEALSKLERPDLHPGILQALADVDARVRLEAVVATHRWPDDAPEAPDINRLLVKHLEVERDRSVAEGAVFALQRRSAPEALDLFRSFARSPRPIERLYGVRGLKALAPHPDVRTPLIMSSRDPDWRVACEATLGLELFPPRPTYTALDEATQSLNPHLRRSGWEVIAAQLSASENRRERELWTEALAGLAVMDDDSRAVRAAFVGAQRTLEQFADPEPFDEEALRAELSSEASTDEEWIATTQALGNGLRGPERAQTLGAIAHYGSRRVAGAALEALGQFEGELARPILYTFLEHEDLGLRLAAVLALAEMPAPEDLPHLARAFETSTGDIGPEVRFNALRTAALSDGRGLERLLRTGLEDPRPFVRRVAREELEALDERVPATAPAPALGPQTPDRIAGVAFPADGTPGPTARVETTRGTMTFELFPAEAPVHVHNFVTLAERGYYDDLIFHRVVPDFVIQGGDYRGDGNGGLTYRGEGSLRHEIGPRKYVRGSLGMPRNDDPDSGGGQIFVTHRPTPHLDGRYTIFGELRDGFEVLDAIEVGDRILGVKVSAP